MANIKFYHIGIEGTNITSSQGGAIDNLQDRNPSHKWTSGSTTTGSHYVTMDLITARACDSCVIDGSNWASTGATAITLEYSSDNSTWNNIGTFDHTTSALQKIEFTSATYRYWRINIFKSGGVYSAAPQIGNIILGAKIEMTIPFDSSYDTSRIFNTIKQRAIDGTYYANQLYGGVDSYSFKFSNITNALSDSMETLFNSVKGSLNPFYYSDTNGSLFLVILNNDENSLSKKGYNVNDVAISFETLATQ